MKLARVVGNVVATVKHDSYHGKKMLWVQPVDETGEATGEAFITLDAVGAGCGETVLVNEEGWGSQFVCGVASAPIQSAIVAIVDEVKVRS